MFTQEQLSVSLRATGLLGPVLRATVIMDQDQLHADNLFFVGHRFAWHIRVHLFFIYKTVCLKSGFPTNVLGIEREKMEKKERFFSNIPIFNTKLERKHKRISFSSVSGDEIYYNSLKWVIAPPRSA
jgi:hypothetical protein